MRKERSPERKLKSTLHAMWGIAIIAANYNPEKAYGAQMKVQTISYHDLKHALNPEKHQPLSTLYSPKALLVSLMSPTLKQNLAPMCKPPWLFRISQMQPNSNMPLTAMRVRLKVTSLVQNGSKMQRRVANRRQKNVLLRLFS